MPPTSHDGWLVCGRQSQSFLYPRNMATEAGHGGNWWRTTVWGWSWGRLCSNATLHVYGGLDRRCTTDTRWYCQAGAIETASIINQPVNGHLNGRPSDPFDQEECYARWTVAATRAQSLTVIVSQLDMAGMMGMMQVLAGRARPIHQVYHGTTTWTLPKLDGMTHQEQSIFFFLRLPIGQYGPVSQLSRSEESCTGPFNWGEAHCAGEKVKRKIGPFQWKSLWIKPNSKTTKGRGPPRQPGTPRPGSQVHGPKRKTTTTNKRLHKQILVRLNVLDLQWTVL